MPRSQRKQIVLYGGMPMLVPVTEYFFYDALTRLAKHGIISLGEYISAQFLMVRDGYIYV